MTASILATQNSIQMRLGSGPAIAGDFVTTADDTIELYCDGTNWFEKSRSVN